jgi:ribosomal protein L30/L7E
MGRKKSKLPTVPEIKLKKRKVLDQRNLSEQLNRKKIRKHHDVFFHAEDFVKESRSKQRALIYQKKIKKNFHRIQKKPKNNGNVFLITLLHQFLFSFFAYYYLFYIFPRKSIGIPYKLKSLLSKLHLRQPGQSVFLSNTTSARILLKKIEKYITYGTPTYDMVELLLQKRAFVNGRSVNTVNGISNNNNNNNADIALSDNKLIEDYFTNYVNRIINCNNDENNNNNQNNINNNNNQRLLSSSIPLCISDLAHEIFTGGPFFTEITTNFLLPFQISSSIHWKRKFDLYANGGERGDRGDDINDFVIKCLG